MELLGIVVDFGQDLHIVRDAVVAHKVDAQCDLVLRHDLLSGDVHLQKARVHKVIVHLHAAAPEVIGTRLEQAHEFVVEEEARLLVRRHFHLGVQGLRQSAEEIAREIRGDLGVCNADHAELVPVVAVAEGVFPRARDGALEIAVDIVQHNLLVADLDGRDALGEVGIRQQGVERAVFAVDDLPLLKDLHRSAAEQAVLARTDGFDILAVIIEKSVLIFVDDDRFHM